MGFWTAPSREQSEMLRKAVSASGSPSTAFNYWATLAQKMGGQKGAQDYFALPGRLEEVQRRAKNEAYLRALAYLQILGNPPGNPSPVHDKVNALGYAVKRVFTPLSEWKIPWYLALKDASEWVLAGAKAAGNTDMAQAAAEKALKLEKDVSQDVATKAFQEAEKVQEIARVEAEAARLQQKRPDIARQVITDAANRAIAAVDSAPMPNRAAPPMQYASAGPGMGNLAPLLLLSGGVFVLFKLLERRPERWPRRGR